MQTTPAADTLAKIIEQRRRRLAATREDREEPREPVIRTPANNRFLAALRERPGRAVIAEIKVKSLSLGSLVGRFDPLELARRFAANGAAALSVVVEPDFFGGSYELLAQCREACGLPVLAKDFVVDPLQLVWAKRAGASAVQLVAAFHPRDQLVDYADQARGLGLAPLVVTHDLADVKKLGGATWELVGVNNRNLRSFEVELSTSMALLPSLPASAVKVSAGGILSGEDVAMLQRVGYQAFLVGDALLMAEDPAGKLREVCG
ncbi:MAG: indole-3-glycerol-phosphate synthase [bacterium]|nr:indole-3-glycerol-phosphate synthase [bacterium]